MVAYQVRYAQSTMEHGSDTSTIGRRAVQTPSVREWSTALSQLRISLIYHLPGCGLPELSRERWRLLGLSLRWI